MKTLLTKLVTFFWKFICIIIAFFAPIYGVLLAVGAFILLDTVVGVWKAKKLKQKITSKRLGAVIQKMLIYQLTILTFFLLGHFIVNDIVFGLTGVSYLVTKLVAVILISIEFFSIDESFRDATGKGLLERLTGLIQKYKESKKAFREDDAKVN